MSGHSETKAFSREPPGCTELINMERITELRQDHAIGYHDSIV